MTQASFLTEVKNLVFFRVLQWLKCKRTLDILVSSECLFVSRLARLPCTWQCGMTAWWWSACCWVMGWTPTSKMTREPRPWCSLPSVATRTWPGYCWRGANATWLWLIRWGGGCTLCSFLQWQQTCDDAGRDSATWHSVSVDLWYCDKQILYFLPFGKFTLSCLTYFVLFIYFTFCTHCCTK